MNILLVEDQPLIRQSVTNVLNARSHSVSAFDSAEQLLNQVDDLQNWPLAILDISLPGMDGITLAKKLRTLNPAMGIVMLTVHQELDKKLQSYEAGADIFLTKPIASEELIATIANLEKRLKPSLPSQFEGLIFDPVKQKLLRADGVVEALSFKEAKVLYAFYQQTGNQLEYWELLDLVGLSFDTRGRKQLEVLMSRLRQKVARISNKSDSLIAMRGVGYKVTIRFRLVV
jgi:DNA-binding response OmpR family regulator